MPDRTEPEPARRSVRLSADEAWDTIERSHTGIFTTLRKDGTPMALPVWFVVLDRRIFMTTPGGAMKVGRVRRDARSSFLVESGERWAELKAVHLTGRATIVVPEEGVLARLEAAQDDKYGAFRTSSINMPSATRQRYGRHRAVILFEADGRILSWDNARLFS